jgi:hypothetical protein
MSDYGNANDPFRRDSPYDLNAGRDGGAWVWIAGAALVVILVALALGIHHTPNQAGPNVAQNNPPAMSRTAPPPSSPASPAFTPAPMNPTAPQAPAKP